MKNDVMLDYALLMSEVGLKFQLRHFEFSLKPPSSIMIFKCFSSFEGINSLSQDYSFYLRAFVNLMYLSEIRAIQWWVFKVVIILLSQLIYLLSTPLTISVYPKLDGCCSLILRYRVKANEHVFSLNERPQT